VSDLATLQIRVDASGAIRTVDQFGSTVDIAAQKADRLEQSSEKVSDAMKDVARDAQEAEREVAGAGRGLSSAAASIEGAFGATAALVVMDFFARMIEESRRAAEQVEQDAQRYEDALRKIVNAGNVAELTRQAEEAYLGTPFESFTDGVVAAQREVDRLREMMQNPLGNLSIVFNPKQLEDAERILAERTARFQQLRELIFDAQRGPRLRYENDPIISSARGPNARVAGAVSPEQFDANYRQFLAQFTRDAAAAFATRQDAEAAAQLVNARAREALYTGEFNNLIGEGTEAVINFGDVVTGLGDGVDNLAESARVFTEQTQLLLADFASDFLKGGVRSLEGFFSRFADLGRDALGQVFAREVMDTLGATFSETVATKFRETFGGGLAGTLGGGLFVGLVGGFVSELLDGASRFTAAMEASAASIADFAERALASTLSPEERQARALLEERNALARNAAGSAGYRGGDGTLEGIRRGVLNQLAALQQGGLTWEELGIANRLQELLAQLASLEDAYAANVDAVKEQVEAERALVRERQASSLQAFADSLTLSGQSPLSPSQQLTEARRQYDAILALAQGGDQSAIDSLPEAARTLLDASRAMFASSTRYADEFARVQADLAGLIATLGADGTLPLPGGGGGGGPTGDGSGDFETPEPADGGFDELRDALVAEQQAQLTVLQDGFALVADRLAAAVTRLEQIDSTLRTGVTVSGGMVYAPSGGYAY